MAVRVGLVAGLVGVVGLAVTAAACGVETPTQTSTTQAALSSGAAIDFAEDWVNHWFAPDTGQRGANIYGHESDGYTLGVFWAGDDPAHPAQYAATSDCSYFLSATMKKAYGWTDSSLKTWLCPASLPCGTRPLAKHYYNAVIQESRFVIVPKVSGIQRGDLLAVKYDSGSVTGHAMWAASAPRAAGTTTDSGGATIYLYDVDVIDSSSTYHGSSDLRAVDGIGHGIGKGTIQIITYADGDVAGYKWSTWSGSTKYINADGQGRWTVVGRYDGGGPSGPAPSGLSAVISSAQFDQMFPPSVRQAAWTYDSFISAAASRPEFAAFGNTGDMAMRAREVAAFLANVAHETGQLSDMVENTSAMYCDSSKSYGCPSSYGYKGRGPLQLSWNYNYHDAGSFLGINLLSSPTQVGSDPAVGWKTALWFWMMSKGASWGTPTPMTSHAAMTSGTPPPGFYETIRVINGDLECGKAPGSVGHNQRASRVSYYNTFVGYLGATQGNMDPSWCP